MKESDFEAVMMLKVFKGLQDSLVLGGTGNYVLATGLYALARQTENRQIIGFGSPACEDDFFGLPAQQVRETVPGLDDDGLGSCTPLVCPTSGVTKVIGHELHDPASDPRVNRRRGSGVEKKSHASSFRLFSGSYLYGKQKTYYGGACGR